jgi:hypothetical protein
MKKTIIFIIFFLINIFILSSEEKTIEPLIIEIKINNEIWLNREIIIFNGWPPNIRMIVYDNKIIGINENNIPKELFKNIGIGKTIKGSYKLKLIGETNLPYL